MDDVTLLTFLDYSGAAFERGCWFDAPDWARRSNYEAQILDMARDVLDLGPKIGKSHLVTKDGVKFPEQAGHACAEYCKARRREEGLDEGMFFVDYRLSLCSICGSGDCGGWH